MSEDLITLKSVSKIYGEQIILDKIDLNVKAREFLTILGPSGCGKTTLLKLISGFETPSDGKIEFCGKNFIPMPPQERPVNTVFQNYALFPHMSVFENIAFGLKCKGLPKWEIDNKVREFLKIVRLEHCANRKPTALSGGQQQRVAIARAAINNPLVLLLDEPLSSLDYSLRKAMQIELKQIQERLGITFILVTHHQEEALTTADRVVVMGNGKIEQIGTPREVYEEPLNLHVAKFIGEVNIFDAIVLKTIEDKIEVEIESKKFLLNNKKGFKTGNTLKVLLRPEDIQISHEHAKDCFHSPYLAKVEQVIYKGSTVDLNLSLASKKRVLATQFFNEDDERLDFKVGDSVWMDWYPNWEVLLAE